MSPYARHECGLAIRKFPNYGSKTLARLVYKLHPKLFPNVESARDIIRRLRGAHGKLHRRDCIPRPELQRPLQKSGAPYEGMPQGKTEYKHWEQTILPVPCRCLILSDVHIPYHDPCVEIALEYGQTHRANMVLLNGDTADFFALSMWEKDPRERDFPQELDAIRSFLGVIKKAFPRASRFYKLGNHEERLERYLRLKAPELLGIEEFELKSLLRFKEYGFECVQDNRPMKLGDLNIIHGHEYHRQGNTAVNPARWLFLRAKDYALCGHWHQSSYHQGRTVGQQNLAAWSTGCLCDMHPEWRPLNDWDHGFAFVDVHSDGKFEVQNKFISEHGRVF